MQSGAEEGAAPLISVVIPAYNHEKFIGPAIDSVLAQSYPRWELIVVDDGSTDGTAEVVKSYRDQRLQYFHQENQDAYNTINRGISLAQGEYLAILNSDDVYTPDRLEKCLQTCMERGAQCLFSDVIPIDDSGEIFTDPQFGWNIWHQGNRQFYFAKQDLYTAFLNGNFMVTTSNLFMTAEAAQAVGQFAPLRFLHDYDFIFRMLLKFPDDVYYLADEQLLYYRIHSGNTLGEGAILGRQQDQDLITTYLQAIVPEETRERVKTGAQRLITLGNELHETRVQLQGQEASGGARGVRPAVAELRSALLAWMRKKLSK